MVIPVVLISTRRHCGLFGGDWESEQLAKARGCVFWREIMICFGKLNVLYTNISPLSVVAFEQLLNSFTIVEGDQDSCRLSLHAVE